MSDYTQDELNWAYTLIRQLREGWEISVTSPSYEGVPGRGTKPYHYEGLLNPDQMRAFKEICKITPP